MVGDNVGIEEEKTNQSPMITITMSEELLEQLRIFLLQQCYRMPRDLRGILVVESRKVTDKFDDGRECCIPSRRKNQAEHFATFIW